MKAAPHSESIYPEIVTHTTLSLMTKLTDCGVAADYLPFKAKERSEALLKAWLSAKEASLIEKKVPKGKLLSSDLV